MHRLTAKLTAKLLSRQKQSERAAVTGCPPETHRFDEEFRVDSSEQRGGLCAPQPGGPETLFPGTGLPLI